GAVLALGRGLEAVGGAVEAFGDAERAAGRGVRAAGAGAGADRGRALRAGGGLHGLPRPAAAVVLDAHELGAADRGAVRALRPRAGAHARGGVAGGDGFVARRGAVVARGARIAAQRGGTHADGGGARADRDAGRPFGGAGDAHRDAEVAAG